VLPAAAGALAERVVAIANAADLDAALTFGASGTAYLALLRRSEKSAEASDTSTASAVTQILKAPSTDCGAPRGVVEWCPTALKRRIALWGEPREDFALMQRVKDVFDPHRVLAPGRFCGGL
jgi:glycolate oxidase FAD binding subunit